ncbi:MAG: lysophospholipid acyltransferase family protein [Candidatus Stahlbacteria bacterium]|nr:lysophospholipid acyltransferase family protein [Candidatus Stahlbacteria bacterium]
MLILSWIMRVLVVLIGKSLRIKNIGTIPDSSVMYIFWHSDFFPLIYANRGKNISVLVSTHKDGEYLSRIISPLGYKAIRGSSDEGGGRGVLKILRSNNSGIAIAPDGPKGPANYVKYGTLKVAQLTGLSIVPVGVSVESQITFSSWDKFRIPIPFSRCTIYWGKPIRVKESNEEIRIMVETALIKANEKAFSSDG